MHSIPFFMSTKQAAVLKTYHPFTTTKDLVLPVVDLPYGCYHLERKWTLKTWCQPTETGKVSRWKFWSWMFGWFGKRINKKIPPIWLAAVALRTSQTTKYSANVKLAANGNQRKLAKQQAAASVWCDNEKRCPKQAEFIKLLVTTSTPQARMLRN